MNELLQHPAVQGGVAPFVVALVVAAALGRTRYAWLAVVAAYATMVILTTGFSFSPLTAGRKIVLLTLVAAAAGIVIDALLPRARALAPALVAAVGLAALWALWSILSQRQGLQFWLAVAALALFAAAMAMLLFRLRDEPLRAAAAGVGLGLATGIAAVLSASIGFLLAGVAVAAGSGALLLVWVVTRQPVSPGFLGTLTLAIAIALFAEGAAMLAQMPWYAVLALLLVPLAVLLPVREDWPVIGRAFILTAYALVAASVPIAAAWYAARATSS